MEFSVPAAQGQICGQWLIQMQKLILATITQGIIGKAQAIQSGQRG